jgi:hypothetical protein
MSRPTGRSVARAEANASTGLLESARFQAGPQGAARAYQLQELELLRGAVLPPDETLTFLDADDDLPDDTGHSFSARMWDAALRRHVGLSPGADSAPEPPLPLARLAFRVQGAPVWFEVLVPPDYAGGIGERPDVRTHGTALGRAEAEQWHTRVAEAWTNVEDGEYAPVFSHFLFFLRFLLLNRFPLYELFSGHLLPLLHAPPDLTPDNPITTPDSVSSIDDNAPWHALMTSHHLKAPSKRRDLFALSSSLGLAGFAKLGHPGVLYAAGSRSAVEAWIRDVRGWQWLALRVRFVEALEGGQLEQARWEELEKVGEVVDWMRNKGREHFVVEMGIGSAGGAK